MHGLIDGSSRVNDGAEGRNGARRILTLPNIAPEDDTLGAAQHGAVDDLQGGALGIHLGPAGDKCWHRTVSGDFPKSFGSAGVIGFNDVCSMLKAIRAAEAMASGESGFGIRCKSEQGKASTMTGNPSARQALATRETISNVRSSTGPPIKHITQTPSTPRARASSTDAAETTPYISANPLYTSTARHRDGGRLAPGQRFAGRTF